MIQILMISFDIACHGPIVLADSVCDRVSFSSMMKFITDELNKGV